MHIAVDGRTAVTRLASEDPQWLPAVRAALVVAERSSHGRFTGAQILAELRRAHAPRTWYPNFRRLVSFGVVVRSAEAAPGPRAYYEMPDIKGVRRGLKEVAGHEAPTVFKPLSFTAIGRSGLSNLGANSEEILHAEFPPR